MTHICVGNLGRHWFKQWLVAWSAPSHYLNQCWNIVNWTSRNKLQWNSNRNSYIFIQENALENVICEMASILFRPQCVKSFQVIWRSGPVHSIYIILSDTFLQEPCAGHRVLAENNRKGWCTETVIQGNGSLKQLHSVIKFLLFKNFWNVVYLFHYILQLICILATIRWLISFVVQMAWNNVYFVLCC